MFDAILDEMFDVDIVDLKMYCPLTSLNFPLTPLNFL